MLSKYLLYENGNQNKEAIKEKQRPKIPVESWNKYKPKKRIGSFFYDNHDIMEFSELLS